jgi:CheY-like chemotaxis protein
MHRILIIDDDDAVRGLLKERLEDRYEVVETSDPTAAMSLALDLVPDCILMDLLMPCLTGFELCKTLSSLSLTHNIPIIVVSGNPLSDYGDFCSHLGAFDYFQKPIDFRRLRERIAQLIELGPSRRSPDFSLGLHIAIELRGLNRHGKAFHEITATEDVSAHGFRCACVSELDSRSVVEVFLRSGEVKRRVGRAQVVQAIWNRRQVPHYSFQFMQKPAEWLL